MEPLKILITGHRIQKLANYDETFIRDSIRECLWEHKQNHSYIRGYVGMASGVDLWFCEICKEENIPYYACIPFDSQDETMSKHDAWVRKKLIEDAMLVKGVRNSWMVEEVNHAIVVWDGNKGGTHNVVQQLVEKKINFHWINPVAKKIWDCNSK